jgi:hypothetical protein
MILMTVLLMSQVPVGFEVLTAVVMKSSIFWDIMQSILLKVNHRFKASKPAACFMQVSLLAYSLTLKMEVTCPAETLVDTLGSM